jgi:hypothetical protein
MEFLSEIVKRLWKNPKGLLSLYSFVFVFWPMWIATRKHFFLVRLEFELYDDNLFKLVRAYYNRYENSLINMLEHWDDFNHPLGYEKKRELENTSSWLILKCLHNCNKALKENSEEGLWLPGSLVWGTLLKLRETYPEASYYCDIIDKNLPNVSYIIEADCMVSNKIKIKYCHQALLEIREYLLTLPLHWTPEYNLLITEDYIQTVRELVRGKSSEVA